MDQDGDGLTDFPADPGCASASDPDERSPTLACDDGLDDDGDGYVDAGMPAGSAWDPDPGCRSSTWPFEDPQCQDGRDNDNQPGIDFDSDVSIHGVCTGTQVAARRA